MAGATGDMQSPTEVQRVPLLDLKGQYATIKDEIHEAIERVVESQYFILGPEVEALEKEIAEYCACEHAVGMSSGTDALLAGLMALGVSTGDEVVTSPFTFFATVGSILRLGAVPVFVDIEPETFNLDPVHLATAISPKTKAIIPVHLFGQSVEMDPLLDIAESYGLPVIEDAAQAIGTAYKGRRAGSMGTMGCFSFFPSKNLGAFGDGGIVTTHDASLAEQLKVLRNQGSHVRYHHTALGGNFRLDAIQAAVLRVKLKHLETWTEMRRANAAFYTRRFREAKLADEYVTPPPVIHERHVFNQYVIRVKSRDALKQFLQENRIATEIYYPIPMHLQECVNSGQFREGSFPVSEEAAKTVLALPIYPELSDGEKEYVVSRIHAFFVGKG